jgi:hypothetical protein
MTHPALRGVELRIRRATRYINETADLLTSFASELERRFVENYDPVVGFRVIQFPDLPADLPLAISDGVHNLRSAADYFVYELARIDSGTAQHGTQFPICDTKPAFDSVVKRHLRGVNQQHRGVIESLQPFRGCRWTRILREISNPDKHRTLTPISKDGPAAGWIHPASYGRDRGTKLPTGDTLSVDPTHAVLIDLPGEDGYIVQTLYMIQGGIVDAINLFHDVFPP